MDTIDFEHIRICQDILAMEKAIKETTADGPVWENGIMKVFRKDGKIFMQGKPFRIPFIYSGAPSGRS